VKHFYNARNTILNI
jgi:hypothetical protein